jgi:hypothetical protein
MEAVGSSLFLPIGSRVMPHKANADWRHHVPQPKRQVANWAEY